MDSVRQFLPVLSILLGWILLDRLGTASLSRALRLVQLPSATALSITRVLRTLAAILALLLCSEALDVAPRERWSSVSTLLALLAVGFVAFWSVLSNTVCDLVLFVTAPFKPEVNFIPHNLVFQLGIRRILP